MNKMNTPSDAEIDAEVTRALDASPLEHRGAIDHVRCPICDAAPGEDCTYGAAAGHLRGQHYPGRAHTRRVRIFLREAK